MRILGLSCLYLAPVATFAAAASITGFSGQLVEHSGTGGQSVISSLLAGFEADALDAPLEVASVAAVLPEIEPEPEVRGEPAYLAVPPLDLAPGFDFSDYALEAVMAEFEELIVDAGGIAPFDASWPVEFSAVASAPGFGVGAQGAGKGLGVAQRAVNNGSGGPSFNFPSLNAGSSSGGSAGAAGLTATGLPDVVDIAGTAGTSATAGATGAADDALGLTAVPVPASAPLLAAGIVLLSLIRRKRS